VGTIRTAPQWIRISSVAKVNPRVQGMDGAVRSFVEYLYALAESR
jgi:hypothetical protein